MFVLFRTGAKRTAFSHTECLPEAVAHQQQREIHVARHAAENALWSHYGRPPAELDQRQK